MKASEPRFSGAVVVRGGRIAGLCSRGEGAAAAASTGCEFHDYGDALVCPGFHDAHQHVLHAALFPSEVAAEFAGESEADCVERLREWERDAPPDGWLLAHGWRDALWSDPMPPTRDSLDAAFPERPVCLYSGDAHTVWLNSAGLNALGIDEAVAPPPGGSFDRDADGHLTGVLREAAGMVYMGRVLASIPRSAIVWAYRRYFDSLLAQGVTSVCDMALSAVPGFDCVLEDVYEEMLASGDLPLRVNLFPQLTGDLTRIRALQARLTGDWLRVPGVKQFFDGVSSAHTAWLTEPYANPRFDGDCGRPTIAADEMRALVMAAAGEGIAVRIHTIGDRAIHEAIDIFAEARARFGQPAQGAHTIEHVECPLPEDIPRMAEAGIVASCQPQHALIDVEQPERDLGPERAQLMWPFATMLRENVPLAFGTDAPCVPPLASEVLTAATTRPDLPSERIPLEQALAAYTQGTARAVARNDLGTLDSNNLADITVLAPNSFTAQATYVGGTLKYVQK